MSTSLLKALSDLVNKFTTDTDNNVTVVKKFDEEQKKATFVVMKAYNDESEHDLHFDTWETIEIEKARTSYKESCGNLNLEHLLMIDSTIAEVDEDYIALTDMQIGDELITKGSWIQTWKFNEDSIWEDVKSGHWCGLSIQCSAIEEYV